SITIRNSGKFDGEEVVQLYIRDMVASITPPVKELKNFKKIFLKAGESQSVTFTLTEQDLRFYNASLEYTSEPGDFKVFVGPNSRDVKEANFRLLE
ncbi:MAG: fibronectin type III-like domain-contianing protein, partial [Bacteroidota bacterium]|nr:fibronectin type III-like domain-contianing protein [Bacteroidota bacterium]